MCVAHQGAVMGEPGLLHQLDEASIKPHGFERVPIGPTEDEVLILICLAHEQLFLRLSSLVPFHCLNDIGWNGDRASRLLSLGRLEDEPRLLATLAGPINPHTHQLLANMRKTRF
jgi:hypothetical protein